jgi:hypothetical protein
MTQPLKKEPKIEINKDSLPWGVTVEEAADGWLVRFGYDPPWNRLARQHGAVFQGDRKAWLIADPRPLLKAFWETELSIKLGRTMISAGYAAEEYLDTLPLIQCHKDWEKLADVPVEGEVEMTGYCVDGGFHKGRWSITSANQVEYYHTDSESATDLWRGMVDWDTRLRVRQAITLLNLCYQVLAPPEQPRPVRKRTK